MSTASATGAAGPTRAPQDAKARAEPEVDLRNGDEIRVGATIIRVEIQALGQRAASRVVPPLPPPQDGSEGPARRGMAVGPYVVDRLLGKGGMGAVYLARHRRRRPAGRAQDPAGARRRGRGDGGAVPARDRGHPRAPPPEHRLAARVRPARGAHVLRARVLRARQRRVAARAAGRPALPAGRAAASPLARSRGLPRHTRRASCTATSSPTTCCSPPTAPRASPTSALPRASSRAGSRA